MNNSHTTKNWSVFRNFVTDFLDSARKKNNVHGFGGLNVTNALRLLEEHENKTGEKLSFSAFVLHSIAKAVAENPIMHAIRTKKKLILFDDVDVSTIVEKVMYGQKYPQNYIVRSANKKTYKEIHDEIRSEQNSVPKTEKVGLVKKFASLPKWMRKIYWKYLDRHPIKRKEWIGTVGLSSIGMFTREMGWVIPVTSATLAFTLGGIYQRVSPKKENPNEFTSEDHLSFTITIDHDIVDGAPASRFVMRLAEILEKAECLERL